MILVKSQQPTHSRSSSAPPVAAPTVAPTVNDNAMQDEAMLVQLARQNPALFAPLYERYFDRVYAYCLRRSENAQEAEDLCSLVFTRALSGLHTYREGVFAAWLFGIAHNVVVDYYHKRQRRPLVSIDEVDFPVTDDVSTIELAEDGRILRQLLDGLSDEQRELVAMSLDSELSSQEIGAALGKSAGAVRVQLHRTFKQLRKHYLKLTGETSSHE